MTYIHMKDIPRSLFVNMDDTAIYFDIPLNNTINPYGEKTFFVRRVSSSCQRCTICITIAADVAKLTSIVIFKA